MHENEAFGYGHEHRFDSGTNHHMCCMVLYIDYDGNGYNMTAGIMSQWWCGGWELSGGW